VNKTILVSLLFLTLIFARRDCLQNAERDALGRTMRPEKDTLAISPSGHFYIHFDTTGNAAPDLTDSNGNGVPDYVDDVGIIADSAYHVLVYELGFDEEPFDGDGGYDIFIISYGPKAYGHCYNEGNGISYLKIDNDYLGYDSNFSQTPLEIMQIALVHEYFHAIQYGYQENHGGGSGSDAYFYEMSSMWIEDVIVPESNDYLEEIWVGRLLDNPEGKFDNRWPQCTNCDGEGYELALFGHYLSSHLYNEGSSDEKQTTIMRDIWTEYSNSYINSNNYDKPLVVIDRVLQSEYQISFIDAWTDFISRNLYNGIYENMDNPYYYYIDQALIDPIKTTGIILQDSILFELDLDNESAAIKSFHIESLESIFTIEHDLNEEEYIGRVAIVSSSEPELNNLFWGSDTPVEESYSDVKVHFIYGVEGSSITLPIEITAHTVPLPPSNLMAVVAQDSIILSWNPSPGPGDSLYYVVYRDGDSIGVSIDSDTNYVDLQGVEAKKDYTYKVTCHNDIGGSDPSNTIAVTSWPGEENVFSSKILSIYPNPIRKSQDITILYALDSDYTNPIIDIINIRGEIVNSYNLSSYNQGWHRENINSILKNNPSTGLYFIRLQHEEGSEKTTKITILN